MTAIAKNVKSKVISDGIRFEVTGKIYPLEAVYQTAYLFIDKYYVYLDKTKNGNVAIELRLKEPSENDDLEKCGGEFYNELLNQLVRRQVAKQNEKLRELIVARALFGALGPNSLSSAMEGAERRADAGVDSMEETLKAEQEELDRLLAEIENDFAEDPLGIAAPWDEKNKKEEENQDVKIESGEPSKE